MRIALLRLLCAKEGVDRLEAEIKALRDVEDSVFKAFAPRGEDTGEPVPEPPPRPLPNGRRTR